MPFAVETSDERTGSSSRKQTGDDPNLIGKPWVPPAGFSACTSLQVPRATMYPGKWLLAMHPEYLVETRGNGKVQPLASTN